MTVGCSPHLHTDDRVRRASCRQHVLLSAVAMTITVLENYKLCGGTSAVHSDLFFSYSGGEERLSNTRFGRTSSRKQPLLNRQHPLRQHATRRYPNARTHRIREKYGVIRVLIFCITEACSILRNKHTPLCSRSKKDKQAMVSRTKEFFDPLTLLGAPWGSLSSSSLLHDAPRQPIVPSFQ